MLWNKKNKLGEGSGIVSYKYVLAFNVEHKVKWDILDEYWKVNWINECLLEYAMNWNFTYLREKLYFI